MRYRAMVLVSGLSLLGFAATIDEAAARCTGCSCRGGPGFRSPEGTCVSWKNLVRICGPAPHAKCKDKRRKPQPHPQSLHLDPALPAPLAHEPPSSQFATIGSSCLKRGPR